MQTKWTEATPGLHPFLHVGGHVPYGGMVHSQTGTGGLVLSVSSHLCIADEQMSMTWMSWNQVVFTRGYNKGYCRLQVLLLLKKSCVPLLKMVPKPKLKFPISTVKHCFRSKTSCLLWPNGQWYDQSKSIHYITLTHPFCYTIQECSCWATHLEI